MVEKPKGRIPNGRKSINEKAELSKRIKTLTEKTNFENSEF